jgi:hypothetical protein
LHALKTKGSAKFQTGNPIPSDFFWRLLSQMEKKIIEYDVRTDELKKVLTSGSESGRRKSLEKKIDYDSVIELLMQQHRAFKRIAEDAAIIHEQVDILRREYPEHYLKLHGELPRDIDLEDKLERDRMRRLQAKIERQSAPTTNPSSSPGQQQRQQQQQQPLQSQGGFTNQSMSQSQPQSGIFGSNPFPNSTPQSQPSQGLFGNPTPIAPASGGGGLFSPIPSSGGFSGFQGLSTPAFASPQPAIDMSRQFSSPGDFTRSATDTPSAQPRKSKRGGRG